MIGGPVYCRICNGEHSCVKICSYLPLQEAQIATKRIEKFISKIHLLTLDRENIKKLLVNLREVLKIPTEPIYNYRYRGGLDLAKIFPNRKEEFERKEKEFTEKYQYQPTKKQIKRAKTIFEKFHILIMNKGRMSENQEFEYKEAVQAAKKELKLNGDKK